VIGEHGDSEVLTWSLATIGGMSLEEFARLCGIDRTEAVRKDIDQKVWGAAYDDHWRQERNVFALERIAEPA
jgi:L-lactate dehydrogenase